MAVDNYFEENNVSIPVMLSGTITDKSGRTPFWSNSLMHS